MTECIVVLVADELILKRVICLSCEVRLADHPEYSSLLLILECFPGCRVKSINLISIVVSHVKVHVLLELFVGDQSVVVTIHFIKLPIKIYIVVSIDSSLNKRFLVLLLS